MTSHIAIVIRFAVGHEQHLISRPKYVLLIYEFFYASISTSLDGLWQFSGLEFEIIYKWVVPKIADTIRIICIAEAKAHLKSSRKPSMFTSLHFIVDFPPELIVAGQKLQKEQSSHWNSNYSQGRTGLNDMCSQLVMLGRRYQKNCVQALCCRDYPWFCLLGAGGIHMHPAYVLMNAITDVDGISTVSAEDVVVLSINCVFHGAKREAQSIPDLPD